ncbi:MAG: HAMP domain-containing protein [Candidatus Riflebacteria bacterium]|nr:HAMP domain-containing protein [Candidatus Riflebacteria bacterium]
MENKASGSHPFWTGLAFLLLSLLLLNLGWRYVQQIDQEKQQGIFQEEVKQKLEALSFEGSFDIYAARHARKLRKTFSGKLPSFSNNARDSLILKDLERTQSLKDFPEHETWVFSQKTHDSDSFETLMRPENSVTSNRGAAMAFQALLQGFLAKKKIDSSQQKLIEFLFGPVIPLKNLAIRKGIPTRVIYRNVHHIFLWESFKFSNGKQGGFFLFFPDQINLQKFALKTASEFASRGTCLTGYLRIHKTPVPSIFPQKISRHPELASWIDSWNNPKPITELEQHPLPWNQPIGEWMLFTRVITGSSHLAFLLSPKSPELSMPFKIKILNALFLFFAALAILFLRKPDSRFFSSLQWRFVFLYVPVATLPITMVVLCTRFYLNNLEFTQIQDLREELTQALNVFDKQVGKTYRRYQSHLRKLQKLPSLHRQIENHGLKNSEILSLSAAHLKSIKPSFPWASMFFVDPYGNTLATYSSNANQDTLEGFVKFSRVGQLEALRKISGNSSIENATDSTLITEWDRALKKAYETLVGLPVEHVFLPIWAGEFIQISFGSFSLMEFIDYFETAKRTQTGYFLTCFEDQFDKIFCAETQKLWRQQYRRFAFSVYQRNYDYLAPLVREKKSRSMHRLALSASIRNGFIHKLNLKSKRLEIAFPSKKRPGIILIGSADLRPILKALSMKNFQMNFLVCLSFISVIVLLILTSRRIILPLFEIREALQKVREGNLSQRIQLCRDDEIGLLGKSFNNMIQGVQARERLASLVSEQTLKKISEMTRNVPSSDERIEAVSLVSDIRNFTTMCELYSVQDIISLLNEHFENMSRIIRSQEGDIDKFIGDAIEAVFPCTTVTRDIVVEKAVKAGLAMIEENRLINTRRLAAGLFQYKTGVGISLGHVQIVQLGESAGRTDVSILGDSPRIAAECEAASKANPIFPLVMDQNVAEIIQSIRSDWGSLKKLPDKSESHYVFSSPPPVTSIFDDTKPDSSSSQKENKHSSFNSSALFFGSFSAEQVSLTGFLFLGLTFGICFWSFFSGEREYRKSLVTEAHKFNKANIETLKNPSSKKHALEIKLQKLVQKLGKSSGENSLPQSQTLITSFENQIKQQISSWGITPRLVMFRSLTDRSTVPDFLPNNSEKNPKDFRRKLSILLDSCLSSYHILFNRYIGPEASVTDFLGKHLTGNAISRDSRGVLSSVTLASNSFLLYWQPVIFPRAIESLQPTSMSGHFSQNQQKDYIKGALLLLFDTDISTFQTSPEQDESYLTDRTCSIRISLKEPPEILENNNFNALINSCPELPSGTSRAAIKMAFDNSETHGDWVIDREITSDSEPQLIISAKHLQHASILWSPLKYIFFPLLIILSTLAFISWFRMSFTGQGPARSITWQIFAGFLATAIIPLTAIFSMICFQSARWESILHSQQYERFLSDVEQIELQASLHQFEIPEFIHKTLYEKVLNPLSAQTETASGTTVESKNLEMLLSAVYPVLFQEKPELGLNSIMAITPNHGRKLLNRYGAFSESTDPMNLTLSFLGEEILNCLSQGKTAKNFPEENAKTRIQNELTASFIFEVMQSSFGPDALTELIFGQDRNVRLFCKHTMEIISQKVYPNLQNPEGLVYVSYSHFCPNHSAIGRVLNSSERLCKIFASHSDNPCHPVIPETGEKWPFIRLLAMETLFSNSSREAIFLENGERFKTHTVKGNNIPQIIFTGVSREKEILLPAFNGFWSIWLAIAIFSGFLIVLTRYNSRDILFPIFELKHGMGEIENGNYLTRISLNRNDELSQIADTFNEMAEKLHERHILSRMVSQSAQTAVSEEATEKTAAILYLGIPDFEKLLHSLSTEDMRSRLNQWISISCRVVKNSGGDVDKILSGKILAVFYPELLQNDNIDNAIARAVQCFISLRNELSLTDLPGVCAGVHHGEIITGFMGSRERRDFTVIGDTVNLAARCFTLAETLGGNKGVISKDTSLKLPSTINVTSLGQQIVKGKNHPVELMAITL